MYLMSFMRSVGVFGMYDFDGGNVHLLSIMVFFALPAQRDRKLWYCSEDTHGPKGKVTTHKGMDCKSRLFTPDILRAYERVISGGDMCAIQQQAHQHVENAQPLVLNYVKGTPAMAPQRKPHKCKGASQGELEYKGAIFQTTIDSEGYSHHIARERLNSKQRRGGQDAPARSLRRPTRLLSRPRKLNCSQRSIWF